MTEPSGGPETVGPDPGTPDLSGPQARSPERRRPDNRSLLSSIIFLVALREIRMRLRSRVFAIGTVAMVALVVIGIVAASALGGSGPSTGGASLSVGFSGGAQALEPAFESTMKDLGQPVTASNLSDPSAGRPQVAAGTLDMFVSGSATSPSALVGDSVTTLDEIALDAAAETARLSAAGLPPATITGAMAGVPFETVETAKTRIFQSQNLIAALGVAILLMITLSLNGNLVAQGVVEEKATRIIEILLATIPPSGLLAGKIVGIGLIGLLQLVVVAGAAVIAVTVTHLASVPALGAGLIATYLVWFVLGFLLYSSAFAAVAALVSRPEEVQGSVTPVQLLIAGSYLLVFLTLPDPSGPVATVASMLPPFAPILMSVRLAASDVALWQVAVALVLTLASIPALVWAAGRIYANSVLRTGSRVRISEAWRGR